MVAACLVLKKLDCGPHLGCPSSYCRWQCMKIWFLHRPGQPLRWPLFLTLATPIHGNNCVCQFSFSQWPTMLKICSWVSLLRVNPHRWNPSSRLWPCSSRLAAFLLLTCESSVHAQDVRLLLDTWFVCFSSWSVACLSILWTGPSTQKYLSLVDVPCHQFPYWSCFGIKARPSLPSHRCQWFSPLGSLFLKVVDFTFYV